MSWPDPGQVQRGPLPESVSPCGLERVLGRPSDHGELGNDSSFREAWVPALPLPPVLPLLALHLLSDLFRVGIAGERPSRACDEAANSFQPHIWWVLSKGAQQYGASALGPARLPVFAACDSRTSGEGPAQAAQASLCSSRRLPARLPVPRRQLRCAPRLALRR